MTGLVQAAEEQAAAGDGLLATVGVGDTLALGRYYLYGTGRWAGAGRWGWWRSGLLRVEGWALAGRGLGLFMRPEAGNCPRPLPRSPSRMLTACLQERQPDPGRPDRLERVAAPGGGQ